MTATSPKMNQVLANGLVCFMLEVHLWSGKKRLRKEALIAMNPAFEKLPPETLATLGSIKICDAEELNPFMNLKRQAEKLLASSGLPFMGAISIPDAKVESVVKELEEIKKQFRDGRDSFESRFESRIEEWRAKPENKEWASLIRDIPDVEHVVGKMSFTYHVYRINPPSDDANSKLRDVFGNQVKGLKGEMFEDAAREATILITRFLSGDDGNGVVSKRESVTWKTLRPLKRIAEKFRSFSFVDDSCEPMAAMIDHVLKLLPTEGPIDGVHLVNIWALATMLSDASRAMTVAQIASNGAGPAAAFDALLPPTQQLAVPAAQATGPTDAAPAIETVKTVEVHGVTNLVPSVPAETGVQPKPEENILMTEEQLASDDEPMVFF